MSLTPITTVLFDLDGTLLDTAPDFAFAINEIRTKRNQPALPLETIRPAVSHGVAGLIETCFGMTKTDLGYEELAQEVLACYTNSNGLHSRLFPGMQEVLDHLDTNKMAWGVVTNKNSVLAEVLMEAVSLRTRAKCIVGGNTAARPKPHPDPLLHACKVINRSPKECLYVGDAERDIIAGLAAGMQTAVALFGYLGKEDKPHSWNAQAYLNTPPELLLWLAEHGQSTG